MEFKNVTEVFVKVAKVLDLAEGIQIVGMTLKTVRNETVELKVPGESSPVKTKKRKSLKSSPTLGRELHVPKTGGKFSVSRKYTTSDEDLNIIRQHHLNKWKKEKKLSEDQLMALSNLSGMRVSKMDHDQRNQMLSIFEDVRKAI